MPDKVTLWRASNGMHYRTQGEAEMAEAEAELRAFITSQAGGGDPALRDTIVRLCLGVWDGMPRPARDEVEAFEDQAFGDPAPAKGRGRPPQERGAAVFARYAAAIAKHADNVTHATGSRSEADEAGREVVPVQVTEPVRRRAIRSSGREPATPEGDRPAQGLDFDSLPRPVARRSSD